MVIIIIRPTPLPFKYNGLKVKKITLLLSIIILLSLILRYYLNSKVYCFTSI